MASLRHFVWTLVVGSAATGFVFYKLVGATPPGQDPDVLTLGVVGLVAGLWAILQVRSLVWQLGLRPDPPDVPATLRIERSRPDGGAAKDHLPDGVSEQLAHQAAAGQQPPRWLGLGSTTLISLGLAGTFLGLTLGLFAALPQLEQGEVDAAIGSMLDGAKLAFVKSLVGIGLAMLWNFRLLEVRQAEDELRSAIGRALDTAYPPLSTERLLADLVHRVEARDRWMQGALTQLRGDDGTSIESVRLEIESLSSKLDGLAEDLPASIGTSAGTHVGSVLQPKLEDLSRVLQALGSTGKEAIGDAMKANMGDEVSELRLALVHVSQALATLPQSIAQSGAAATGTLSRASDTGARQLAEAAGQVAEQTQAAAASVQQLRAALDEVHQLVATIHTGGELLRTSFSDVAAPLQRLPATLEEARIGVSEAGRVVRDDVGGELRSLRDTLQGQRDAHAQALEAWKTQRRTVLAAQAQATTQLVALQQSGRQFADAVDALRDACAATVDKLDRVTGDQRQGADQAIEQLLQAVGAFSKALSENEGAIKDASLRSVATTEQVTTAAARQVAQALVDGATGLQAAMDQTRQLSEAVQSHTEKLVRGLQAADTSLSSMEAHSSAMVSSGQQLKQELHDVAAPFADVRAGLEAVAPAVASSVSALEAERSALTGLAMSLKDQAALIRSQEAQLSARTAELQKLHEVLGTQWSGHVGRMAEAHKQVRSAWQEAMKAAGEGLERNAQEVATYAQRVEKALGLRAEVRGLQDNLGEVADSLSDLTPVLQSLGGEVERLRSAVDGLEATERL